MTQRRVPWVPLPTSTFVAGRTPRPPDDWFSDVDRADWFAFGCDLFDAGCYFEAHELWEQCWRAAVAVDNDDDARFVHGLIRLAAAGVKLLDDKPGSRAAHVGGAKNLLTGPIRRGLNRVVVDAAVAAMEAGHKATLCH